MYLIKSLFPVFLLKQIHYRHRKQGEEEDDYGAEGDDFHFTTFTTAAREDSARSI